jgi:hypothetical protein
MATTYYELWDLAAGNLLGAYPSEETALAEVRAGVQEDGAEAWREVGLRLTRAATTSHGRGESERIAEGNELIARALAALSSSATMTAVPETEITSPAGGTLPDEGMTFVGEVRLVTREGGFTLDVRASDGIDASLTERRVDRHPSRA